MRALAGPLPDQLEILDQIIDIVIEVEAAFAERHQLRVAPVGDVNVAVRQQPLNRTAQKRRIMARHRRDDQQRASTFGADFPEIFELAEGLAEDDVLIDSDRLSTDLSFDN